MQVSKEVRNLYACAHNLSWRLLEQAKYPDMPYRGGILSKLNSLKSALSLGIPEDSSEGVIELYGICRDIVGCNEWDELIKYAIQLSYAVERVRPLINRHFEYTENRIWN